MSLTIRFSDLAAIGLTVTPYNPEVLAIARWRQWDGMPLAPKRLELGLLGKSLLVDFLIPVRSAKELDEKKQSFFPSSEELKQARELWEVEDYKRTRRFP